MKGRLLIAVAVVVVLAVAGVSFVRRSHKGASEPGGVKRIAVLPFVLVSPELVEVSGSGAPISRWQQSFDAELTGVFQVQADIATRVARSLGVALEAGEEKRLAEKPTQNLAAYDAYLRGEEASKSLGKTDPPSLRRALSFYEQAVALDPGFAVAYLGRKEEAVREGQRGVALTPLTENAYDGPYYQHQLARIYPRRERRGGGRIPDSTAKS